MLGIPNLSQTKEKTILTEFTETWDTDSSDRLVIMTFSSTVIPLKNK